METEVITAIIAAGTTIGCAIYTYLTTRASDRRSREHETKMERFKSKLEMEMKRVEAQLVEQQSERGARRAYEYEARKRLYTEVEPVLFQLVELSEAALHRIYSLARTARNGNLSDPAKTWLHGEEDYYYRSTLYSLMAPMAAVKLLQRRITFVDLSVVKSIAAEYVLAKRLLVTFTDDFDLAQCEPPIEYNPDSDFTPAEERKRLQQAPQTYRKQGMVIGDVETCAECLLTEEAEGRSARVKSFSEFDAEMDDAASPLRKAMGEVPYLFLGFHPAQRPVLWRVLVTQACIYRTFVSLRDAKLAGRDPDNKPLKLIPATELLRLDWRGEGTGIPDHDVLEIPLQVAVQYFQKYIPALFENPRP